MSGVSLPVTRPSGRALIMAAPPFRAAPLDVLQRLGFTCAEFNDPYAATAEICRRPMTYRAVVLSLNSLYREELPLIQTLKQRFPHLEIWLSQTDNRPAVLAEAMRLGADGLLSEDGLHRTATGTPLPSAAPQPPASILTPDPNPARSSVDDSHDSDPAEPVLTAEELRALLQEQPSLPPTSTEEHNH